MTSNYIQIAKKPRKDNLFNVQITLDFGQLSTQSERNSDPNRLPVFLIIETSGLSKKSYRIFDLNLLTKLKRTTFLRFTHHMIIKTL